LDWNWFYSSAAQSVAAIVGILAAFLIAKIISNQTTFKRNRLEIRNLINVSKRLVERADHVDFKSYNDLVRRRQLSELKDSLEKETSYKSPDEYFNQLDFSKYDSKQEIVPEIKTIIKGFKDGNKLSLRSYAPVANEDLNKQKEIIDSFLLDVQQNTRAISSFLDSIEGNPESSYLITFAIFCTLILFFAGVILPLVFLPFENSKTVVVLLLVFLCNLASLKGVILALVSIIFLLIMGYFLYVNHRLRYGSDELKQVRSFARLSAYSKYLLRLEDNP
jgi:hypothetical protein